ncbi:TonB-dependent receptor [Erythrobacter rubeus]|uniref:TonB-dependent receptor n=1 Tax=Erythrobacter rubeus TaxID=2760803 RepID=A0ABR8KPQ2_9SPHN|nr:TonB-dependent receptor [Erythrobacter rubeus]MBD2840978.1 TonB-dependent receptor [Erythrobacter rubeus]
MQAHAQDAPSSDDISVGKEAATTDEIVVRGQRLQRTEFETATSVSVFTGDDLQALPYANDVEDVLERIPNIVQPAPAQPVIIRGVDTNGALVGGFAFSAGPRPRVTTVVDGYSSGFFEYVFGATSVYDIKQIEVFRGPQTTTQGANAIGGAIFVYTNDPTFETEAGALVEVGNLDSLQSAGYVSGPLIDDQLAGRLTVDYRRTDSATDYSDNDSSLDLDELEAVTLRGKLLWTPSALPDLEAKLTLSYAEGNRPTDESVIEPFDDRMSVPFFGTLETFDAVTAIVDVAYDFNDSLRLTNQFAVSDYDQILFNTEFGNDEDVFATTSGTRVSNETILTYDPAGGSLRGLAGLFYIHQNQPQTIFFVGEETISDEQESIGLFVKGEYDITDRLELSAGLRYQRDEQTREGVIFFAPIDFEAEFDAFLPKAELAYDVSENVRVGVSASRGFNPGGVTVDSFTGEILEFDEETVWTFDAFARTVLLDGRLTLNGNIFFSDYDNFQTVSIVGFDETLGLGTPLFNIANVDGAQTYGLEMTAEYKVTDRLELFGSLGLLEAEFRQLVSPGQFGTFEFGAAPGITGFAGASFDATSKLRLSGQVRYVDSYFSTGDNVPVNEVDSYAVVDVNARYDLGRVTLYAFAENLFDSDIETDLALDAPVPFATLADPIRFGVGLQVAFE